MICNVAVDRGVVVYVLLESDMNIYYSFFGLCSSFSPTP